MAKIKRWLAGGFLLLMGPWMLIYGWTEAWNSYQLSVRGSTVTGKVVDRDMTIRLKGRNSYYVTVEFQPESGVSRTERLEVGSSEYRKAGREEKITVHYLAEKPAVCAAGAAVSLKFGNFLCGLLMSAGALFLLFFNQTAKSIANSVDKLCVGKHEYALADTRQFPHLDHAWLNAARDKLQALGFAFLQDTEDLTFTRGNSCPRTFIRMHLGRNGTTSAGLYHFKPAWWMRLLGVKDYRVCDTETHFTDGTWVCTGNAEAAGKLEQPPGVNAMQFPAGTPIEALVQAHDARVAQHLARSPGVQAVAMRNAEDVLRAQNQLEEIKSEFRRGHGLSKAEMERLGGKPSEELDELHDEVTRLHKERHSRAA
jgi:hypothetical protein